jgi:hypothetical protein
LHQELGVSSGSFASLERVNVLGNTVFKLGKTDI